MSREPWRNNHAQDRIVPKGYPISKNVGATELQASRWEQFFVLCGLFTSSKTRMFRKQMMRIIIVPQGAVKDTRCAPLQDPCHSHNK